MLPHENQSLGLPLPLCSLPLPSFWAWQFGLLAQRFCLCNPAPFAGQNPFTYTSKLI